MTDKHKLRDPARLVVIHSRSTNIARSMSHWHHGPPMHETNPMELDDQCMCEEVAYLGARGANQGLPRLGGGV